MTPSLSKDFGYLHSFVFHRQISFHSLLPVPFSRRFTVPETQFSLWWQGQCCGVVSSDDWEDNIPSSCDCRSASRGAYQPFTAYAPGCKAKPQVGSMKWNRKIGFDQIWVFGRPSLKRKLDFSKVNPSDENPRGTFWIKCWQYLKYVKCWEVTGRPTGSVSVKQTSLYAL